MRHLDLMAGVDEAVGLPAKLETLLAGLRVQHPAVERLAVALYDPDTGRLRAAYNATVGGSPLLFYEAELAQVPGLQDLRRHLGSRVIQDLEAVASERRHTQALLAAGFRASYTLSLIWKGAFEGFIFFDARVPHRFDQALLNLLDIAGRFAGALVLADVQASRTLQAAVRGATRMVHVRDPETGGHLYRMAHFSRMIAVDLAQRGLANLDEETVEQIYAFAPMHDLGKLGIPDQVLFKPEALTPAEQVVMRRHPILGRQLVDELLEAFNLAHLPQAHLLQEIAEDHHEKLDGSGYPTGLHDGQVSLAARIIAVADVFDALTSQRPYKPAWSNDRALAYLQSETPGHLDPDCVSALATHTAELLRIQGTFKDE